MTPEERQEYLEMDARFLVRVIANTDELSEGQATKILRDREAALDSGECRERIAALKLEISKLRRAIEERHPGCLTDGWSSICFYDGHSIEDRVSSLIDTASRARSQHLTASVTIQEPDQLAEDLRALFPVKAEGISE